MCCVLLNNTFYTIGNMIFTYPDRTDSKLVSKLYIGDMFNINFNVMLIVTLYLVCVVYICCDYRHIPLWFVHRFISIVYRSMVNIIVYIFENIDNLYLGRMYSEFASKLRIGIMFTIIVFVFSVLCGPFWCTDSVSPPASNCLLASCCWHKC